MARRQLRIQRLFGAGPSVPPGARPSGVAHSLQAALPSSSSESARNPTKLRFGISIVGVSVPVQKHLAGYSVLLRASSEPRKRQSIQRVATAKVADSSGKDPECGRIRNILREPASEDAVRPLAAP